MQKKDPSQANFNIDLELINLITKRIIENKRNKYPKEIQLHWKNFIEDLESDFSENTLQKGISLSRFNEWMSSRYKSDPTGFLTKKNQSNKYSED
ncbi:MAG: hypothetical protein ACFFFH_03575 [Candidatus Thorarchaeota archaeon]